MRELNSYQNINRYVDRQVYPQIPVGTYSTSSAITHSAFFPKTNGWGGDISYGKNPVIESKLSTIFLGSTLTDGEENNKVVRIEGHSYVTIEKILFINTETDDVEIVDINNTDEKSFKRMISENFKEGTEVTFKLLNETINHLLKKRYIVKFNEGTLMKLYTYVPNTGSNGTEDGVFGGWGPKHHASLNTDDTDSLVAGFTNNLGKQNGGAPGIESDEAPAGGLFGFGMTTVASRSLFTTNSIQFVDQLPEELTSYTNDINLGLNTNMGEMLCILTGSYNTNTTVPLLGGK